MDSNESDLPSDEWIAGFFDGEGNIRRADKLKWHSYRASISQSVPRQHVLYEIQARYGGKVYCRRNRVKPHHADIYCWEVLRQAEVKAFLEAMLPHLRCKKQAAIDAIEGIGIPVDGMGRRKGSKNLSYKSHCVNGHEYTLENTIRTGRGFRRCRTCEHLSQERRNRRYREKKRAERQRAASIHQPDLL